MYAPSSLFKLTGFLLLIQIASLTAMKPVNTIKQVLVHPKDKRERKDISEVVYEIPCKACDHSYIGETGRSLGVRLREHQKDCDSIPQERRYTRGEKRASEQVLHKSAVTDHYVRENHLIDWENTKILDRENDRRARQVREAIWIRRKKPVSLNRDEGVYTLSHVRV